MDAEPEQIESEAETFRAVEVETAMHLEADPGGQKDSTDQVRAPLVGAASAADAEAEVDGDSRSSRQTIGATVCD